jgi:hypothetical protein
MDLFRLYAFSVQPQRKKEEPRPTRGGVAAITPEIQNALSQAIYAARFDTRTTVDFDVDPNTRTVVTRELILGLGFGDDNGASESAFTLAQRLAAAMDLRSTPCLLVCAVFKNDDSRSVTLWTFPRDDAFQFQNGDDASGITVLHDVFSQSSKLRKAARFEGRNLRSEFLSGRALDFQAGSTTREVAEFWVQRFLRCKFGLAGDAGTRLFAKAVRSGYDSCAEPDAKEQIFSGVMALRNSPNDRISLQDFADRFLSGEARKAVIASAPNQEGLSSLFVFNREVLDNALQFRVFQLESGAFVSAPLGEVGESVLLTEQDSQKHLSCEGIVISEKLRQRHG